MTDHDERGSRWMAEVLSSPSPSLSQLSLSIATLAYPDLDGQSYEAKLDAYADRVSAQAAPGMVSQLQALRRVLADEEGFRGHADHYTDPDGSFLNQVLETKIGLPISLSIVYLEVARRAGISLFGVSFPGHFLVATHLDENRRLAIDPFNEGKILTETGCEELLRVVAPQVKFSPQMISPAPPKAIAYRLLNNLKRIYLDQGDGERALKVVDRMLIVSPDHPGELRARAGILSALGAYRAALSDVERCLELSPQAPDHQSLLLAAQALRQRVEFLN